MKTVLILEDDLALADDWRVALEAEGYAVVHAQSASEAIAMTQRIALDLVITDIFIEAQGKPEADGGISLLGLMRVAQIEGQAALPVVAVTGAPRTGPYATDVLEIARTMGAVRALHKPVTADEIAECVREIIGRP
jgi:CheY-like chemotaxis protein